MAENDFPPALVEAMARAIDPAAWSEWGAKTAYMATGRDKALAEARAALVAAQAGGWVLVPREATPDARTQVIGRVTGQPREGDQCPGMPHAICHACGLGYRCFDPDCPNDALNPMFAVAPAAPQPPAQPAEASPRTSDTPEALEPPHGATAWKETSPQT